MNVSVNGSRRTPQALGDDPPPYTWPATALVVVGACVFSFLSLSNLTNDHFMYLALAQQLLLGELPGRDFVDPGVPLQYLLSATVQAVAPGPFAEAVLTIVMLALAAGAVCVAVSWLTRSAIGGIAASGLVIAMQSRLYSYPKILVPTVAVCLALVYTQRPGTRRLLALAAWTAIAFLFRYDLGGFAAVSSAFVVALRHTGVRARLLGITRLAGLVGLLLAPYVGFLAWSGGISESLTSSLEFAADEPGGYALKLPAFGFGASRESGAPSLPWWDRSDSAAFLVHLGNALPIVAIIFLLLVGRNWTDHLRAPVVTGAAVMLLMYDIVIIRDPIVARVGDAAGLVAILGAWCVAAAARQTSFQGASTGGIVWRVCARTVLAAAVGMMFVSADILANFHDSLLATRLARGPAGVRQRLGVLLTEGRIWPWERYWPGGSLPPVIEYLNACTRSEDRLLLTWPAPEYYVFARRGFAGGHVWFPHGVSNRSTRDQRVMVSRLERDSVPIALIDESRRSDLEAFPLVAQYLTTNFEPAARVTTHKGSDITIAVRRGLVPRSTYGPARWPCQFR